MNILSDSDANSLCTTHLRKGARNFRTFHVNILIASDYFYMEMGWEFIEARLLFRLIFHTQKISTHTGNLKKNAYLPLFSNLEYPHCGSLAKTIASSCLLCSRISSVQFSHSVVSDSATPWTAARQASLSITNSWS